MRTQYTSKISHSDSASETCFSALDRPQKLGLCVRDTSHARWVGKNTPGQHSKILEGPGKPAHRKGWVPYLTRFPAAPQCHIHVTPCQGYQCTLKTHYLATCGPSQTFFPCFAAAFVLLQIHAGVQNRVIGLPKDGSETRVFPMAINRVQTVIGNEDKKEAHVRACSHE